MALTVGSLFSGIGGLDLGLERAGMQIIWQCECDPYARRVLAKHWPNIHCYEDVRLIDEDTPRPDLICGGFPCQDISRAGRKAGTKGAKSGLWAEFARTICDLRPRFVLVENTSSLLVRGMGVILGDLAASGYDARWDCFPAAAFGAPHIRDRLFILGRRSDPIRNPLLHDAMRRRHRSSPETLFPRWRGIELSDRWACEPGMGRVDDGIPHRVDRLRGLGNAVVPAVAEYLGRLILDSIPRKE